MEMLLVGPDDIWDQWFDLSSDLGSGRFYGFGVWIRNGSYFKHVIFHHGMNGTIRNCIDEHG